MHYRSVCSLRPNPIERTAAFISGLGGTTENPITKDRGVPEETLGSGAARGQAINATARHPDMSQRGGEFICDKICATALQAEREEERTGTPMNVPSSCG
jgi:hypothetical protein